MDKFVERPAPVARTFDNRELTQAELMQFFFLYGLTETLISLIPNADDLNALDPDHAPTIRKILEEADTALGGLPRIEGTPT